MRNRSAMSFHFNFVTMCAVWKEQILKQLLFLVPEDCLY